MMGDMEIAEQTYLMPECKVGGGGARGSVVDGGRKNVGGEECSFAGRTRRILCNAQTGQSI